MGLLVPGHSINKVAFQNQWLDVRIRLTAGRKGYDHLEAS